MNININDINKVKWAARRGMLELDLIFEPFVLNEYIGLSDNDKKAFILLLECEDADLFTWFLRSVKPAAKHNYIVNKILDFKHRKEKKS